MLLRVPTWALAGLVFRAVAPAANVMLLVPDITAGTGTESDETPGWWWPVGLSQSEGAHEMAVSVDGALFRVPGHLGVGRPSIYTTALPAGNPSQLTRWRLPGRFCGADRGRSEERRVGEEGRF